MRLKKNFYTLSLSGFTPGFSFLKGLVRVATMLSTSSSEKKSADFATREQVVNVHHELFVYNLAVGQQPQASFVLERSLPLELL